MEQIDWFMSVRSPRELVERITDIFPEFADEWDDGEAFGYEGDYNFHTVFLTLGPLLHRYLIAAQSKEAQQFGAIINHLVDSGGETENAVSTCLLEHASQLKVKNLLKPVLSREAKKLLR